MKPTLEERLIAAQRRLAPGVNGRIANAAPVVERPRGTLVVAVPALVVVIDFPGRVSVRSSDPWPAPGNVTLREVVVTLSTPGSTATVVTVYRAGVSVGTVTIAAGASTATGAFAVPFETDQQLAMAVTSAGSGAVGLVAQGRF